MRTLRFVFYRTLVAAILSALASAGVFAQTETIIHTFIGGSDGSSPDGTLIADNNGNLYGTTGGGGPNSTCECGTIFEFIRGANGTWTENFLYAFGQLADRDDGLGPQGPLTFDGKGNLYGTTIAGGSAAFGTVFELSPGSNGTWTEKVLYNFTNGADGESPYSGVVLDSAGNLYGTASGGTLGFGVIFELSPQSDGTWTEKILHGFTGNNDGGYPTGPLTFDPAGNLYGIVPLGGARDYGLVFELVHGSNGSWTEKVLHEFSGGSAGSNPIGGVIMDAAGNLYGTASFIAYELSPNSNGTWTAKLLHSFGGGTDGASPQAGLTLDGAGNLYGTTYSGGVHRGTVFELSPDTNGIWTERLLHRFASTGADGIFPDSTGLLLDTSGNVFGTTPRGGTSNAGVLFEIVP